jgi:hypothetical protein
MNVDQINGIKTKRYKCKGYTNWTGKELICCSCGIRDDTIVGHHLRGAEMGLGAGFRCHSDMHLDTDRKGVQMRMTQARWILETLQVAFRNGIMIFNDRKPIHSSKLFGEDLDD